MRPWRNPAWQGQNRRMVSALSNVVINAKRPRELAQFWCQVLGWQIVDEEEGVVSVAASANALPCLDFVPSQEPKVGPNRLHLDLRAQGNTTQEELARLLALGAVRTDVGQGPDASWVVLADPEGNEFCLLSRGIEELGALT